MALDGRRANTGVVPMFDEDEKQLKTIDIARETVFRKPNKCQRLQRIYCNGKECENIYRIVDKDQREKLGEGVYGQVYQACLGDDCSYVGKWVEKNDQFNIVSEGKLQHELALKGIAPEVKQIMICQNGGMIVMSGLKATLDQIITRVSESQLTYLRNHYTPSQIAKDEFIIPAQYPDTPQVQTYRKNLITQVINLIEKLNELHLFHNDLHFNNIMVDNNDRVYIIDMGFMKPTPYRGNIIDNVDMKKFRAILSIYISDYNNLAYLEQHVRDVLNQKLGLKRNIPIRGR